MAWTCFMTDVADQYFLICKPCGQFLCCSQVASSVIAYIDNQSVANLQFLQHLVQVSVADTVGETFTIDVTDVIFQNLVGQSGGNDVILFQVVALDAVAEIPWISIEPFPVLRCTQ